MTHYGRVGLTEVELPTIKGSNVTFDTADHHYALTCDNDHAWALLVHRGPRFIRLAEWVGKDGGYTELEDQTRWLPVVPDWRTIVWKYI